MYILTEENKVVDLTALPDQIGDLRFCVLDNSDTKNPDYFFIPLIFVESFNSPAAVLKIGDNTLAMPLDWSILIGDEEVGDLEVIPIASLNERGFQAFTINPLTSYKHYFRSIEIINIYQDVKWYAPKLKNNQLLTTPLNMTDNPECIHFIKDIGKQNEILDIRKVW